MSNKREYQFLTAEVHVPTGAIPARETDPLPVRSVGPGVLSELDLSDDEVAALPQNVIRPATAAEIEAAQTKAASKASTKSK